MRIEGDIKCPECYCRAHTATCPERLKKLSPELADLIRRQHRDDVRLWTTFAVVFVAVTALICLLHLATYAVAVSVGAVAAGAVGWAMIGVRRSRMTGGR